MEILFEGIHFSLAFCRMRSSPLHKGFLNIVLIGWWVYRLIGLKVEMFNDWFERRQFFTAAAVRCWGWLMLNGFRIIGLIQPTASTWLVGWDFFRGERYAAWQQGDKMKGSRRRRLTLFRKLPQCGAKVSCRVGALSQWVKPMSGVQWNELAERAGWKALRRCLPVHMAN